MKLTNLFAGVLTLAMGLTAQADDIRLGTPAYGGSGCPAGTASATLSPDRKTLSVLFDEYIAEAGDSNGKRIDRKSCNLAIPVHVPQGYSVSLLQVDYRGYVYAPWGTQARLSVEYFFAGQRGPQFRKTFRSGFDDDYLLTNDLVARATVWSRCGADVNLRINSSMMARSNSWGDDVLATVDSTDVKAGIIYQIQWRRCS